MKTNLMVIAAAMTVLAIFGSGCASVVTVAAPLAPPAPVVASPMRAMPDAASRPMRDAAGRLLFFTDPGFGG